MRSLRLSLSLSLSPPLSLSLKAFLSLSVQPVIAGGMSRDIKQGVCLTDTKGFSAMECVGVCVCVWCVCVCSCVCSCVCHVTR